MKQSIDAKKMNRLSWIMLIFIGLTVISAGPLVIMFGWYGFIAPFIFGVMSMIVAYKIEKIKKDKDVQTFAEIVAFKEGKDIDVARAKRNQKKDFWNKTKIVLLVSAIAGALAIISSVFLYWLV